MRLGNYEWDPDNDLIAAGAFAEVFRARDTNTTGRTVALKIYKEAVAKGSSGSSGQKKYTLEQEFHNVDGLSHTNIIAYYGLDYIHGKDAMGRQTSYPVLIMEYAEGGTLTDFLKTDPDEAVRDKLIRDIVQGLGYLHEQGILHRDLKPGNILITKDRRGNPVAKISDFGISRDLLTDKTLEQSYTEGVGTPHYMAPEQFFKKKFGLNGELSERTDLWAVGVILYRMLTGRLPFGEGERDLELVREAITGKDPDFGKVPARYRGLLEKCLAKNAADRMGSAAALLGLFDGGASVHPPPIASQGFGNGSGEGDRSPDDLPTMPPATGPASPKETKGEKVKSKQQAIVILAGLISLAAFFLFVFFIIGTTESDLSEKIHYLIYPIALITAVVLFFIKKQSFSLVYFGVYGILISFSIYTIIAIFAALYAEYKYVEFHEMAIVLVALSCSFGHLYFSFWLFKNKVPVISYPNASFGKEGLLALTALAGWLFAHLLEVIEGYNGFYVVFLLFDSSMFLFLLLPNLFFIVAILMYLTEDFHRYGRILVLLWIAGTVIAALWWLLLNDGRGYYMSLIYDFSDGRERIFTQQLKSGYYLWFVSMFSGFAAILYKYGQTSANKARYALVSVLLGVVVLGSFAFQWKKSQTGFDLKNGLANLDVRQFNRAMENGADFKWEGGDFMVMSRVLEEHNGNNADAVESMVKSLISWGWEGSGFAGRSALADGIATKNLKIVESLLATDARQFLNDTTMSGVNMMEFARNQDSPEVEVLLVEAGGIPMRNTFSYFEDFGKPSSKFPKYSDEQGSWDVFSGMFKLFPVKGEYSYNFAPEFEVDMDSLYTIEADIIVNSHAEETEAGLVVERNNNAMHTVTIKGDRLNVRLYKDSKWELIRSVEVEAGNASNKIRVRRNGNYISCYLNDDLVIAALRITSVGGNRMGFVAPWVLVGIPVYFDNFKIEGLKSE